MGHRLHTATKYDVRFDCNGRFNWANEHINAIICCLAEGDYWCDNGEIPNYADILEADRGKLLNNIERIICPSNDWEYQEELDNCLENMEKEGEFNRQYVYEELKHLIEISDPKERVVHFYWF